MIDRKIINLAYVHATAEGELQIVPLSLLHLPFNWL